MMTALWGRYYGRSSFKASLLQTLQYDRGILDTLAQQTVQQAGITAEFCDPMSATLCAARQVLKSVSLESAQSAAGYASSSF